MPLTTPNKSACPPRLSHSSAFRRTSNRGVSLIELMVAMAVGLFILMGMTTILVNDLRANSSTLKATRLNQELRASMDLMIREIRRSGYVGDAIQAIGNVATGQSFSNTVTISNSGNQLDFGYDANGDGTIASSESHGFRLNASAVQMLQGTDWTSGTKQNITDPNSVEITSLTFCFWPSADNTCLTSPPAGSIVTVSGAAYLTIKDVRISITGRLKGDTSVIRTLNEVVRVRNDDFTNP